MEPFTYSYNTTGKKLKVDSVIEVFKQIEGGGTLHVYLDDGNLYTAFIYSCTEPTQYIFRVKSLKNVG